MARGWYGLVMSHQDPNAREHRNFVLDGEHAAPVEPYPGAGYTVDADRHAELLRVEELREQQLGGDPDFQLGTWMSPVPSQSSGVQADREETDARVRACQGGLPDSPGDARAVSSKPFKV